jgi:hypothetical protein
MFSTEEEILNQQIADLIENCGEILASTGELFLIRTPHYKYHIATFVQELEELQKSIEKLKVTLMGDFFKSNE